MAQFHPSEEWLAAYATGTADEPIEALIAAHLTLCPQCRKAVADYEELAGSLLESTDNATNAHPFVGADAILAMPEPRSAPQPMAFDSGTLSKIAPRALVEYIQSLAGTPDVEKLDWDEYATGIKRAILFGDEAKPIVRLIEAQPGAQFPMHTHETEEMTLILTGAYRDATGRYAAGDVQCAYTDFEHDPTVDEGEVCYAFVVAENLDR